MEKVKRWKALIWDNFPHPTHVRGSLSFSRNLHFRSYEMFSFFSNFVGEDSFYTVFCDGGGFFFNPFLLMALIAIKTSKPFWKSRFCRWNHARGRFVAVKEINEEAICNPGIIASWFWRCARSDGSRNEVYLAIITSFDCGRDAKFHNGGLAFCPCHPVSDKRSNTFHFLPIEETH